MAILRVWNPVTQAWEPIPYIKGDKGDQGNSVVSVEYEYYQSTSSSTPTGGSWSTIMPDVQSGKYIWIREKTTVEGGTTVTSDPALANLLNDVGNSELSRRTEESNRVTAENGRVSAEGSRVTAESSRANAEALRVTAEGLRVSAETTRQNNEATRDSAESQRGYAETQRANAETIRETNELARIAMQDHYPIVRNGTWWTWDIDEGEFVDSGEQAEGPQGPQGPTGNTYFATFDLDLDTGLLTMTTADEYAGPIFGLRNDGYLEVTF